MIELNLLLRVKGASACVHKADYAEALCCRGLLALVLVLVFVLVPMLVLVFVLMSMLVLVFVLMSMPSSMPMLMLVLMSMFMLVLMLMSVPSFMCMLMSMLMLVLMLMVMLVLMFVRKLLSLLLCCACGRHCPPVVPLNIQPCHQPCPCFPKQRLQRHVAIRAVPDLPDGEGQGVLNVRG